MPRKARIRHAGVPQHVIQRGNNRAVCFFTDADYRLYLDSLQEGATRYDCDIHAYVLMTNHVHLLVTPETEESLPYMMRYLGSRYVQYVNHVYKRSGTLWEGRYKSCLIDSAGYLLTCYRYIELNPVRAGMVDAAGDYKWSSYGIHALGKTDELIQDHPCYLALGTSEEARREAYQALFQHQMDDASLTAIREAANSGTALGSERFKDEIEAALARSVRPGKPGRPRKARDEMNMSSRMSGRKAC
ncbi:MAG: transposase [Sideroxydans sp.]|nr:transposase [Sideroxydans sp.]